MFNLLIVDDNRTEREGVKFLVEQFEWELDITESDSGEAALAYLENHQIDILITDIKMKGLDGLQLAEKVRNETPNVKVIFMSAYGEFEYARKAIDLDAINYILKPVEIGEFMRVVSKVIQLCEEERQEREQAEKMKEAYGKGLRFEKQKTLYDLVYGKDRLLEAEQQIHHSVFGSDGHDLRMVMLDAGCRFFDRADFDMEAIAQEVFTGEVDIIHLNERQSLLFYAGSEQDTEAELQQIGNKLIECFKGMDGKNVCVIISGLLIRLKHISEEFAEMETIAANRFFLDGGTVIFTGNSQGGVRKKSDCCSEVLQEIWSHMQSAIHGKSSHDKGLILIEGVRTLASDSETYVKFVCTELLKLLIGSPTPQNANYFMMNIEKIYNTASLHELRQLMLSIIKSHTSESDSSTESLRKVIEDVVSLIEKDYSRDISLEHLAKKVYLSPAYLSRLFKKYTGQSITKYITSIRLEKAAQLLMETNKKITDIYQEAGYQNFAYFSALFKNHYGKTPSEYREDDERS
ncbi:response regulator [Paenibacillus sp. LHD-117]|uniref:response regulator transcription factor n=1 Tax=Paenibacillus sp. LHD-117 TaxID=3071412 RepID=UPI0027E101DD|nr:helix-turn-helix domain-containing protein [Paenibacillus sp. LHD-117]MDQ6419985.1 response regulator [Paenibacillus sp. LHD-117]